MNAEFSKNSSKIYLDPMFVLATSKNDIQRRANTKLLSSVIRPLTAVGYTKISALQGSGMVGLVY